MEREKRPRKANKRTPWWDTSEIREEFATTRPVELSEKYALTVSQIYNIRKEMGVDTSRIHQKKRGRKKNPPATEPTP